MNSLDTFLHSPWTEAAGRGLLHSLWQITAIAAGLALVLPLLQSATRRHAAAVLALMLCLLAPSATFVLSLRAIDASERVGERTPVLSREHDRSPSGVRTEEPASSAVVASPAGEPQPSSGSDIPRLAPLEDRSQGESRDVSAGDALPAIIPGLSGSSRASLLPWMVLVWALGALLFAVRPLLGTLVLGSLRRHGQPAPAELRDRVAHWARRLGLRRTVRLLVHAGRGVPMLIGYWRPAIVLPASSLSGLDLDELDTILVHELAHLRRLDPVVRWFQTAAESLLYHHPGVWWISRVLREERERCTDDRVLALGCARGTYARALLRLEEERQQPVAALAATDGALLSRIRRIAGLETRERRASLLPLLVLAATLAVGAFAGASGGPLGARPDDGEAEALAPSSSSDDDPLLALERQRALNEDIHREIGALLREQNHGRWMVIAKGKVSGPYDRYEDAEAAADAAHPDARHRFIYRPGIDEGDVEFSLSPWSSGSPNWIQLGRRFHRDQLLTVSAFQWMREGRKLATPDGKGLVSLAAPTGDGDAVQVPAVLSGLFEHELTLPGAAAARLGLERSAVPGRARCQGFDARGTKAHCRILVPELGIETRVVAFLIPEEIAGSHRARAPETPSGIRLLDTDLDGFVDTETRPASDASETKDAEGTTPPPPEPAVWTVYGRVTDERGRGIEGAEIRVFCGFGSLHRTGTGHSDARGVYRVDFGPGLLSTEGPNGMQAPLQAATVFVSHEGHVEKQLGRQGDRRMAHSSMIESPFLPDAPPVLLESVPARIDFVMTPCLTLDGVVCDPEGRRLPRLSVSLTGDELPPSSSVLASTTSELDGCFVFDRVPPGKSWRLALRPPGERRALESEDFRVEVGPGETSRVVLVFDPRERRLRVEQRTEEWIRRIGQVAAGPAIRGRPPTDQDPAIAWGEPVRGLRAGLRLEGEGPHRRDELLRSSLILENVGDEPLRFESLGERRYDDPKLRPAEQRLVDVQTLGQDLDYQIHLYELHPGEQLRLPFGPLALHDADTPPPPEARYHGPLPPGPSLLSFRLRLPSLHRDGGDEDLWTGRLSTGERSFVVTD